MVNSRAPEHVVPERRGTNDPYIATICDIAHNNSRYLWQIIRVRSWVGVPPVTCVAINISQHECHIRAMGSVVYRKCTFKFLATTSSLRITLCFDLQGSIPFQSPRSFYSCISRGGKHREQQFLWNKDGTVYIALNPSNEFVDCGTMLRGVPH